MSDASAGRPRPSLSADDEFGKDNSELLLIGVVQDEPEPIPSGPHAHWISNPVGVPQIIRLPGNAGPASWLGSGSVVRPLR